MKERYFTTESLYSECAEILNQIGRKTGMNRQPFEPEKSALLVLDMQKYFLDEHSHAFIPSAQAIIPGINRLIWEYRRRKMPIFFTRHLNTEHNAGLMTNWWKELLSPDDPMSIITGELDVSGAVIMEKSQYDAFYNTQLETVLKSNQVTQLVICGVMTHLCCETTARSAFVRGFEVFFTVDGTATYTRDFHQATLRNLRHGFAALVMVDELISQLCGDYE